MALSPTTLSDLDRRPVLGVLADTVHLQIDGCPDPALEF